MKKKLPETVVNFGLVGDAWLVGSAADPRNELPRDYDIVVPFDKWVLAAALIPPTAQLNTFKGWKFRGVSGEEIDVWPGKLEDLLLRGQTKHILHITSGQYWCRPSTMQQEPNQSGEPLAEDLQLRRS